MYSSGEPVFAVAPSPGHPIRYSKTGLAAIRYEPIGDVFAAVAAGKMGGTPAVRMEKPGYPAGRVGEWLTWTWTEYYKESQAFVKALIATGHQPFKGVAICGFNSPRS